MNQPKLTKLPKFKLDKFTNNIRMGNIIKAWKLLWKKNIKHKW